jgi:hypothetical protein
MTNSTAPSRGRGDAYELARRRRCKAGICQERAYSDAEHFECIYRKIKKKPK